MNFEANHKQDEMKSRLRKMAELFPQLELTAMNTLMNFIYTSQGVYNEMSGKLSEYGLSIGKLKILMPLFSGEKSWTPSELASYSGVTRSTMTSVIDGLERDGLIKRANLEDRRMTAIHITEKGKELVNSFLPTYVSFISEVMKDFTQEDHEMFIQLLRKFSAGLERLNRS